MAFYSEPLTYEWTGTNDVERSLLMAMAVRERGNRPFYLTVSNVSTTADPEALAVVANNLSRWAEKNEIVRIEFDQLPDEKFCRSFLCYADGTVLPVFTLKTNEDGINETAMERIGLVRRLGIKTAVIIQVSATIHKNRELAVTVRQLVWNNTSVHLIVDDKGMSDEDRTGMAEYIVDNGLDFMTNAFDNRGYESRDDVIRRLSEGDGLSQRVFARALDGVDITPSEMLSSISYYRKAILQSGLHKVSDLRNLS